MDQIHVAVSEADIAKGVPMNPSSCPIAQAIKRMYPESYPLVGATNFDIRLSPEWGAEREYYQLPAEAETFIHLFDVGKPVQPIEFVADKIDEKDAL